MSGVTCCSGELKNTGIPKGKRLIDDGTKLYVVPLIADDGTVNGIDAADIATIDQAYIDALVENVDKSKRWYPIGSFTNVTNTRADPATESFSDGSSGITTQGVRTYTGWLLGVAPAYAGKIQSFGCDKIGIIAINDCGGVQGKASKDNTRLLPIAVNEASWYAVPILGSDTEIGKVQLSFEFSQLERDADLRVILKDQMLADADWMGTDGLIDVTATVSNIGTTGFDAVLTVDYDKLEDGENVVTGRTNAGFTVFNLTTNAAVTVTGAVEAPVGQYAIAFSAQTAGNVLEFTGIEDGQEITLQRVTTSV
jgi:hypothetical protein